MAIVTGSFERGVERALARAGVAVDHLVANRFELEDGALTGAVDGPLFEARKDQPLTELGVAEGVGLDRKIAVGGAVAVKRLRGSDEEDEA